MFSTTARLLLFALILFVSVVTILEPLSVNLANLLIYKSLVDDNILAIDRQHYLEFASKLMLLGQESENNEVVSERRAEDMISLIYRGLHDYRNGMNSRAASWFGKVAESPPIPSSQRSLLVSPFVDLEQSGSIVIAGNNPRWNVRSDSFPGTSIEPSSAGQSILSCSSNESVNNRAAFSWNHPNNINYHHTMEVEVLVPNGSYFVIETVTDGELIRHLVHRGNGRFEQLLIPLLGENLEHIYILLRSDTEDANGVVCQADLRSIKLIKDNTSD